MASNPNNPSSRLAHLTCPSSVVDSSDGYSWDGIILEHHRIPEGERIETVTDRHVLWLWTAGYSGEYAGHGGRFVRCSKGRGAITVTPVGLIPTLHSYRRSEVTLCALDSHFIRSILSELDRQLMTLLLEEVRAGGLSGKLYCDSLAHALAIRYLLLGERPQHQRADSAVSALPPYALKRVLERIEHSFQFEVSLASLAEEAGYSRGHFLKMFRTSTGMTPHHYLLKRRIDHARSLLKRPEISIIDVAADCGFSSQAHLTQVFREHVGVTPGDYRRNQ